MRFLLTFFAILVLMCASEAFGQALRLGALPTTGNGQDPSAQTARPADPWYIQYYSPGQKDPRTLIQERAQFYAQQRQLRIASRAWYGISVSRPSTTADIMFADRAPRWTSGSVLRPYEWSFSPPSVVIVQASQSASSGN